MAADFRQFKGNITVEADVMIDAIAEVTGKDRGEVVRDVLHEWALLQIRITTVARRRLKAEVLTGSDEVPSGTDEETRTASHVSSLRR